MKRIIYILLGCFLAQLAIADERLTGTVIGTELSVDYSQSGYPASTTVNTREMAFDGDLQTYFASYERSYTWVGLDLGEPHVITRVGWSPRDDGQGEKRVQLGLFEGANSPDFMDALPLYMIDGYGTIGQMDYGEVKVSRGFRYVRYIGPSDARCNIAEVEFYGHKGEGDNSQLPQLTNLPTVIIHTKDNEEPYDKEHEIECFIQVVSQNGKSLLSDSATIRERGNYSRNFPKKPYRIRFAHKQFVAGSPAKAKKWCLINNYGDKTLMRNLLGFQISKTVGLPYTPYCTCVDVMLNGEYKGCYHLADQIEIYKGRVDIKEMENTDNEGEALTGGYLFEADGYAGNEPGNTFTSASGIPITIKSPKMDDISIQQRSYIENYFNLLEADWQQYLDLETFLKYFIIGELCGNTDAYWSTFMYKNRGDKFIYTGPVWDFDIAFENDNRVYPINTKPDYLYHYSVYQAGTIRNFVDKILSNASAKEQLKTQYASARNNGLSAEQIGNYLDEQEAWLQQSQRLNFIRWPIMNQYVHINPHLWGSYEAEVDHVRTFIKERFAWMDNKLEYTPSSAVESISIDYALPYTVFTLLGQPVGNSLNHLPQGIYIVRQGEVSKKVIVP